MAIVFLQQRKVQRSLIFVLIAVIIITVIVLWKGFFGKEIEVSPEEETLLPSYKEIKINYEVFKNPVLERLQPFVEIKPLEEIPSAEGKAGVELGRENPFLPY